MMQMLQAQRPQLRGCSAAAQVQPTHTCRQSQFADAQNSPDAQQVGKTVFQEACDAWHQEVENQGEQDHLKEEKGNEAGQEWI